MKKIFFTIIALIIVMSVVSCGTDKQSDTDTENQDKNNVETLSPDQALSATDYVIVRADLASQEVKSTAAALRKSIKEKTGIDVKISTNMNGTSDKEILVGESKRTSTEGILLDQFKITRSGNTITIIGGSDAQTTKGVEFFVENLVSSNGFLLADGYSYTSDSKFSVTSLTVGGSNISSISIATDIDNTSFAANLTAFVSQNVGIPAEQIKKIDNANVIITDDSSLGIEDGSWAVLTKNGKIYLVGSGYYEQKAAYDYLSDLIKATKGTLALDDGIIKSEKIQTKEEYYEQKQLVIYPELPAQIRRNYDYKVSVTQGDKTASIPVYNHTMEYADYTRGVGGEYYRRYSMFAFSGEQVRVDIKVGCDFSYYSVMPSAKNFKTTYSDGVISVYLDKPDYFMIRLDEDDSSVIAIAADYPEYPGDIPEKDAPGVTYVEGWFETPDGLFELTEVGAQLYVAPGAVLNARCKLTGAYSRVTGRGVVVDPFENIYEYDIRVGGTEGSGWKMMQFTGDNSYFDGLTFMDARCFNLSIKAGNCEIYNYKAFSTMMTTDAVTLSSGENNRIEHMMVHVGDNVIVYSVKNAYVKDVLCGTTCGVIYPQGDTSNVTFENIYVMRASTGFINNLYNSTNTDREHSGTLINSDAVDCINMPQFFKGEGMGKLEKNFTFKNISLPKLTGTSNPHGVVKGLSDMSASRLFYVANTGNKISTSNYRMTVSNLYVNGELLESADQVNVTQPYCYITIENDGSYKPVSRITYTCSYVAEDTVHIGALRVNFEHEVVKQDGKYYLPAAILKQLRVTDASVNTTDIGGIKYVCETDIAKLPSVESISHTNSGIVITPNVPNGNLLLEDEGEISHFSEATSYTVDLVVEEEDGEKRYYMYDHGKYYKPGIARTITNEVMMYGAGTYTLTFEAKAPDSARISTNVRYDTEPALKTIVTHNEDIDGRWCEVEVTFEITEEMIENNMGIYFSVELVKEISTREWFAARNFTLTK